MGSKKMRGLNLIILKKKRFLVFVKDIRNIYQTVKQKENLLKKLFI